MQHRICIFIYICICICYDFGLTGAKNPDEEEKDLVSDFVNRRTLVFVKQPLALPGSAENIYKSIHTLALTFARIVWKAC